MGIRLIIDSASDINMKEADSLGITMIPMQIRFGGDEYLDGVDLLPSDFYNKLIESDDLPQTSQINPFRFAEEFEKAVNEGDEVIVITISSKLSGTYNSAVDASAKFDGKVYVVDSLNACIGERLLCQYALRLIKEGKLTTSEVVDELNRKKTKINVIAMLNTLQYLKKGGRISSAVAFAGELFNIKPVVAIIDGEVKLIGKAIGSRKGNNLLNTLVEKTGGIDFAMPFGVVWSGTDDTVLKKYIEDSSALWEGKTEDIPAYIIGSTIGTHIGPGAIGVSFFSKEEN